MDRWRHLANGACIVVATGIVIHALDLSYAWYGAALLAWLVRTRYTYRTRVIRPGHSVTDEAARHFDDEKVLR